MWFALAWLVLICLVAPVPQAWAKLPKRAVHKVAKPAPKPPRAHSPHRSGAAVAGAVEAEALEPADEPSSDQPKGQNSADKLADLKGIWKSAPGKPTAVGLIVELATGRVIFDDQSAKAVYPASVAKLLTTAAFVRLMDLDKKPATEVRASAKGHDVELAVIGAGDPTLNAADWDKLAADVRAAGITHVKRLTIDAQLFDEHLPKGFDEKDTDAAYRAPIGAISVDAGTLQVVIRPGAAGQPPEVTVTPDAGAAVEIINQAQTVAKAKRSTVGVTTRSRGQKTEVLVSGSIALKSRPIYSGRRRVSDAVWFAAWVFRQQLVQHGVAVQGPPVLGPSSLTGPVVAHHVHHDWRAILAVTNKKSHNGYAETLFKQVGVLQGGAPSTADKSAAGVKKALADLAIRWDGVRIGNGSGLYHANLMTAQAIVDLLTAMHKDPKGAQWRASLAVSGKDGTLRGRMKAPETLGRVQAKTGTLDDVSGLAGYAESGDGTLYAFAFFFNNLKSGAGAYRGVQDRMLRRLLTP